MRLISSKNEVYSLIQEVKENNQKYITNLYIDQEKLDTWITERKFYYTKKEEGLLFFRQTPDFYYLYYSVGSLEQLSVIINGDIPKEILVIDIIGKTEDTEHISTIFRQNGFIIHTCLERYTRINKESTEYYQLGNEITLAEESDGFSITEMMHGNFDKYAEQLYTLQDVLALIKEKKIIVIRDTNMIKGFLIRNILPQSSVLNNFLVNPENRGEKIGSKLLKHYIFESKNTKRMWLWVLNDNEHAINLYKRHGYTSDGLIDLVMILNNKNEQNN